MQTFEYVNNEKLIKMYPKCDHLELYIDSQAGIVSQFGKNYRILALCVYQIDRHKPSPVPQIQKGAVVLQLSITNFDVDLIYQVKDKLVPDIGVIGKDVPNKELYQSRYSKIIIEGEQKEFKGNKYYPHYVEPVKITVAKKYDLDTLASKKRQRILHDDDDDDL